MVAWTLMHSPLSQPEIIEWRIIPEAAAIKCCSKSGRCCRILCFAFRKQEWHKGCYMVTLKIYLSDQLMVKSQPLGCGKEAGQLLDKDARTFTLTVKFIWQ